MSVRLALVSTEFPPGPGGIGAHAFHVARELRARGTDVRVITAQAYASGSEIAHFNAAAPFPIVRLEEAGAAPARLARRWHVASRAVREWAPDVVMATGTRAVWLGAALARRYRLPLMAMGHGSEFADRGAARGRLTRWAYGQAAAVVCVSDFTWRTMEQAGIRPRRGTIIHNGADDARFRVLPPADAAAVRAELALPDARLLVTVGQVTERKGQDAVIRAMPDILRRVPNAHYLIVGLPTRREEFQSLAQDLGVAEHVHFLGRQEAERVVRILNAADLFVMTSRRTGNGDVEGYGIAVVEAALCGTPAVVTRDSGLAEAIVHGETGLGVPEDDTPAVSDAITGLLTDEPRRLRLARSARLRAECEQTWTHKVSEYELVLRELAGSARPHGSEPVRLSRPQTARAAGADGPPSQRPRSSSTERRAS